MTIEKALPKDAGRIAALAKEIWTEHYTPLIGAGQVNYMLGTIQSTEGITEQMETGGYAYYIVRCDGEDAGYCGVQWQDDKSALFLSKLYVAARHRKKGFSKALLERAMGDFPALQSVYLTVYKENNGSIEAYKRMGFVITDKVYLDIGQGFAMDDFVMTLTPEK